MFSTIFNSNDTAMVADRSSNQRVSGKVNKNSIKMVYFSILTIFIPNSQTITFDLVISEAEISDAGLYTCRAFNSVGSAKSTVNLQSNFGSSISNIILITTLSVSS